MKEIELAPIDYLAQMINASESRAKGYDVSTLWLTLRQDLKNRYKKEANEEFNRWKQSELDAKKRRDSH